VDATGGEIEDGVESPIDDKILLKKFRDIDDSVVALKQYFTNTKNPITIIKIDKKASVMSNISKFYPLKEYIKILAIVDKRNNDINNPYMLLWRVVNNIDAMRDIKLEPFIIIDGTNKNELDGFSREWPDDTHCTKEVLDSLQQRGLVEIDEQFIRRFGLLPFD
jgi:4-hydroxy-3-polyprenylbenzoate decarboxylase